MYEEKESSSETRTRRTGRTGITGRQSSMRRSRRRSRRERSKSKKSSYRTRRRSRRQSPARRSRRGGRRQSSPLPRLKRKGRMKIDLPNENITIFIPFPEQCNNIYTKKREKIYCGNKERIPSDYSRAGNQYECLRKGFGAGMCSIYRQ